MSKLQVDRRKFLGASAAALAAPAMLGAIELEASPYSDSELKLCNLACSDWSFAGPDLFPVVYREPRNRSPENKLVAHMPRHGYEARNGWNKSEHPELYRIGTAIDWELKFNEKYGRQRMMRWGNALLNTSIKNKIDCDSWGVLIKEPAGGVEHCVIHSLGLNLDHQVKFFCKELTKVRPTHLYVPSDFGPVGLIPDGLTVVRLKELCEGGMLRHMISGADNNKQFDGMPAGFLLHHDDSSERYCFQSSTKFVPDSFNLKRSGRDGCWATTKIKVVSRANNSMLWFHQPYSKMDKVTLERHPHRCEYS